MYNFYAEDLYISISKSVEDSSLVDMQNTGIGRIPDMSQKCYIKN